jgi:DNA-binding MarR family transcriptional regulator
MTPAAPARNILIAIRCCSRLGCYHKTSIPRPGEGKRGEEGYFGYLLRQASAAHRLKFDRALADIEVTQPQFLVLTMLAAYPGASNAELARLTLLTPQTVNVIVANLERAGALVRTPHAVHGRILELQLTEKGKRLLKTSRERAHALERDLAQGLSPEEQKLVRRWLARVAAGDGLA